MSSETAAVPGSGTTTPRRAPTLEESRALAHPVRLRIIRELYDGPLTNNQLAQRLGRGKATVLHHVRVLLDTGFVAALPPRPGPRGSREQPYRGTGKSWTLAMELGPEPDAGVDAMLAAVLEELRSAGDRLMESRAVLRLDETELDDLRDQLQSILDNFAAREPTPGGRKVGVYLNLYEPGTTTSPVADDPPEG
jgi:DNA-binding transcriptional ArsR family regulator